MKKRRFLSARPCQKGLRQMLYSRRHMALASLLILPLATFYTARSAANPQIAKTEVRARIVRGISASAAAAGADRAAEKENIRVVRQVSKQPCRAEPVKGKGANGAKEGAVVKGCSMIVVDNY